VMVEAGIVADTSSDLVTQAHAAHAAGLCVLPPKEDGSKQPDAASWTPYQRDRSTREEIERWYANGHRTGIGLVCGAVSGQVELFEFDDPEIYHRFLSAAQNAGLTDLVSRITQGWSDATPAGGIHWYYRLADADPKTTALARRPATDAQGRSRPLPLIETKGEGGYVITAPSHGTVHPSGRPYHRLAGGPTTIATITAAERDALWSLARHFDEVPKTEFLPNRSAGQASNDRWLVRPGDDYNDRMTWEEILTSHDWEPVRQQGEETLWRRPDGYPGGWGASTNHQGLDRLYVWTTATPFDPDRSYAKFAAYTTLEHGGDFPTAARALAEAGYGKRRLEEASSDADPSATADAAQGAMTRPKDPTHATLLVELATTEGMELFHDEAGEPYASIPVDGHLETWPLRSKVLRQHLARLFFLRRGRAPGSQALQDALQVLDGEARFAGDERPVAVRLADHEAVLSLDLGDRAWRVIAISATGWTIRRPEECSVRFRRPRGQLPLPDPIRGGRLDALGTLLNLGSEEDLVLVTGWLLGCLFPRGPRPILQLLGEQGSAKSTQARLLRSFIDPNVVPLRTQPRDEGDLLIAAIHGAVVALDNLSELPRWLSDALCRLATGGGLSKRELYTDAEEILLDARRPVLLTAIGEVATASDLLDRCLTVVLPPIPSEQRRTEAEVEALAAAARPAILGALLDAAVVGLRNLPTIHMERRPRMADFATWVEAAAPALGWEPGTFLDALEANRRTTDAVAIEALPIGPALLAFMGERDAWQGTATALLTELDAQVSDETRRDREWPKRANRLATQLRRLAPNLRATGLWVGWGREGGSGQRLVILTKNSEVWQRHGRHDCHGTGERSSQPSSPDRHGIVTTGSDRRLAPAPSDDGDGCDDAQPALFQPGLPSNETPDEDQQLAYEEIEL
jgi:hypothetical protein